MQDYKGVSFSFKAKKLGKRRRTLIYILLFMLIVALFGVYRFISESRQIVEYQERVLNLPKGEALETPPSGIFFSNARRELKAVYLLEMGNNQGATAILNTLNSSSGKIDSSKILNGFLDRRLYFSMVTYSDFLINRGVDAHYFRGVGATAFLDYKKSLKMVKKVKKRDLKKALVKLSTLNSQIRKGKVNFIFDRNGKAIGRYNIGKNSVESVIKGIEFRSFKSSLKKGLTFYKLTLDKDIHSMVDNSFKGYKGSFVLMDLKDNGILAAYSKPLTEEMGNTVFTKRYAPASVVKLMTAFAWMHSNRRRDNFFPFKCLGNMRVDNKTFYDWSRHDKLESIMEAMAVSCNMVFAKFGIEMGYPYFSGELKRFGFNRKRLKTRFFTMDFGKLGVPETDYELGKLSIGLQKIDMTTIHGVYIASLIAKEGVASDPYLVHSVENLMGIGVPKKRPDEIRIIEDNRAIMVVKDAMVAVMKSPVGTGRRGKVPWVSVSAKTGTAGERKTGFHAVMIGYFPSSKPVYAFAFRLEHGGKADKAGAKLLKRFLTAFRSKLRK